MKQSKNCWAIYLALFLLLFLILLPFKEGFDGHDWLDFSGWFTTTETPSNNVNTTVTRTNSRINNLQWYNDSEGTGNTGKKYIKTDDENDELTSNEKTYARSALTKIIAMHDNNDVLKSCVNKVKLYL